jgi:murein DD-endopeptidase MepM/ murein hydrolase activator NlpD
MKGAHPPPLPILRFASILVVLAIPLLAARCERVDASTVPHVLPGEPGGTPLPVEAPAGASIPIWLPTQNTALFTGDFAAFYQGVPTDTIPGLRDSAWEAGQYGFVRDPVPVRGTPSRRIFRRLHEGLDIRPLHRDHAGEPLDTVRAIADGTVAYVSSGYSAYGNYVVVEHTWSGSPVFSLYAHLDTASVRAGTPVSRGAPLGRLGYSGRGLGRDRAHIHLEVALMLNEHEVAWHDRYIGQENLHGRFFGTNLAGVDVADLYRTSRLDTATTFADFVRGQRPAYQVLFPGDRPLDLLGRYPWLLSPGAGATLDADRAWLVSFTQGGVPIRVTRRRRTVDQPTLDAVAAWLRDGRLSTNRLLLRTAQGYEISDIGRRYLALIATTESGPPPW